MAESLSTAAQMVQRIEQALLDHPVGVVEIVIDGTRTRWDRKQALAELGVWRRKLNAENRAASGSTSGGAFQSVDLSGAG